MLFGEPIEAAKALVKHCPTGHILLRPHQTSADHDPNSQAGSSMQLYGCYNPQDNPNAGLHFELHEADVDMLPQQYCSKPVYQFWPILDLESDMQSDDHSYEQSHLMDDDPKPQSFQADLESHLHSASSRMNFVLEHMCYVRSDFHTLALQWKRLRPNDASAAKDTVTFVRLAHAVKQVCITFLLKEPMAI